MTTSRRFVVAVAVGIVVSIICNVNTDVIIVAIVVVIVIVYFVIDNIIASPPSESPPPPFVPQLL